MNDHSTIVNDIAITPHRSVPATGSSDGELHAKISVKSLVEDPKLVARRRAQLVQAAVTLFSRIGYHASTVRDVAEEAGVSAGLVYQYVSDKEELLYLTILDICERVRKSFQLRSRVSTIRWRASSFQWTHTPDRSRQISARFASLTGKLCTSSPSISK